MCHLHPRWQREARQADTVAANAAAGWAGLAILANWQRRPTAGATVRARVLCSPTSLDRRLEFRAAGERVHWRCRREADRARDWADMAEAAESRAGMGPEAGWREQDRGRAMRAQAMARIHQHEAGFRHIPAGVEPATCRRVIPPRLGLP